LEREYKFVTEAWRAERHKVKKAAK
jgi:hypothetical protein